MAQYSDKDLIERYITLRNYKKKLAEDYKAEVAKVDKAMELVTGVLISGLRERQCDSIGCSEGTAYRQINYSVRTSNQEEFRNFVMDGKRLALFYATPYKEAALEFLEQHKQAPPGLVIDSEYVLRIRAV